MFVIARPSPVSSAPARAVTGKSSRKAQETVGVGVRSGGDDELSSRLDKFLQIVGSARTAVLVVENHQSIFGDPEGSTPPELLTVSRMAGRHSAQRALEVKLSLRPRAALSTIKALAGASRRIVK